MVGSTLAQCPSNDTTVTTLGQCCYNVNPFSDIGSTWGQHQSARRDATAQKRDKQLKTRAVKQW